MVTLTQAESQIKSHRLALDAWLNDAYANIEDRRYYGEMDASFPNWGAIESLAGSLFDNQLVSQISSESLDSILFFISRNDEIGSIIAWLSPFRDTPLSWLGELSYDDFMFLCERSLERDDDFCDYQLATCFQKLPQLNQRDVSILNRYFDTKSDSYTRRIVLHAFEKFRLPETVRLAERLWNADECEFAKLSCLYSLKPFPNARGLFDKYLREYERQFPSAGADYRQSHLDHFYDEQAK